MYTCIDMYICTMGNMVLYGPWQVCFRCRASCGRRNPSLMYTNINEDAPWRRTEHAHGDPPWEIEPALIGLVGFTILTLALDIMHCFHLGCGRDLVGGAVKLLCRGKEFFDGRTIAIRLQMLMMEAIEFARRHGKQLSFARLKKTNITWKRDKCPELKGSASDTSVFVAYLSEKLQSVQLPHPYEGVAACVWTANMFFSGLANARFFLDHNERDYLFVLGRAYIASYAQLASVAFSRCEYLFKLRPKFHILTHLVWDIAQRDSGRNPSMDALFIDEDFVKWSLRKYRKMSRQTASLNLLRRCLVQQQDRLRQWRR